MRRMATVSALLAIGLLLLGATAPAVRAETIKQVIERIREGRHASLPPAEKRSTPGPVGRGMTVENRTAYVLRVYFRGPVARAVRVAPGRSVDIALAVGRYEVAGEAARTRPGVRLIPFYGRQEYKPNAHYWLRFYTRRAGG